MFVLTGRTSACLCVRLFESVGHVFAVTSMRHVTLNMSAALSIDRSTSNFVVGEMS